MLKLKSSYRATLPLTDTKESLSTECNCAHNDALVGANGLFHNNNNNNNNALSAQSTSSALHLQNTPAVTHTSAVIASSSSGVTTNGGNFMAHIGGISSGISNIRTSHYSHGHSQNHNHNYNINHNHGHSHNHCQCQHEENRLTSGTVNDSVISSTSTHVRHSVAPQMHHNNHHHYRSPSVSAAYSISSSNNIIPTVIIPSSSASYAINGQISSASTTITTTTTTATTTTAATNSSNVYNFNGNSCGDKRNVVDAVEVVGGGGSSKETTQTSTSSASTSIGLMHSSSSSTQLFENLLRNNGATYFSSSIEEASPTTPSAAISTITSTPTTSMMMTITTTTTTTNNTNNNHNNYDYSRQEKLEQNCLEDSPRRHSSMDQLMGLLNDMGKSSRTRSLSDGGMQDDDVEIEKEAQPDLLNNTPPVPPKRSHRRRHTPPRPVCNGLPPTPKVHMGACFSKIFNGCPLRVHCTASWIHRETRDQHLLIGAEEGIFNLNMNELHDAAIDQLFPRRTTWLYVIKDVLMSLSGKSCQLYRHDLVALHSKQTHRFSMHMNKIPERLVPRKYALTTKVPDTKSCTQCCVTRNPYNGYKYLCGATPSGIFLMQWYDPLNKFMLLKQCEWPATSILGGGHGCVHNGHTPVFEMIITPELEYPIVCTGVRKALNGCLKLELINMNSASWFHADDLEYDAMATMVPRRDLLKVVKVHQVEKDAILVCFGNIIQIVTLQGNPKQHKKMVSQLNFDFNVDSIVCLPDSVLAFHKHGMQGKSLRNGEISQEIKDMSRTYRLLGSDKVVALESQLVRTGSLGSEEGHDLYILAGHEASY